MAVVFTYGTACMYTYHADMRWGGWGVNGGVRAFIRRSFKQGPHNPTSHCATTEELQLIGDLCKEFDSLALYDEV